MSSEELGEVFEYDSADSCAGKFPLMSMGRPSRVSSVGKPRSKDPHRLKRKYEMHKSISCLSASLIRYEFGI
jgi:hypothetical protein